MTSLLSTLKSPNLVGNRRWKLRPAQSRRIEKAVWFRGRDFRHDSWFLRRENVCAEWPPAAFLERRMHIFGAKTVERVAFGSRCPAIYSENRIFQKMDPATHIFFSLFRRCAEQFKKLEEKTGYSKVYFFFGSIFSVFLFVWVMGGLKFITDLMGFVYPAYMSFQSVESAKGVSDSATQWLTYWVVFSFITVVESTMPGLHRFIPMYYYNKAGLIVWLYHPRTNGAEIIYNQVVRTYILPHLETTKATKKEE